MSRCIICNSEAVSEIRLIPERGFDALTKRMLKSILSCHQCGYERNNSVLTYEDALNLQKHFDDQTNKINTKKPSWPSRAILLANKIEKLIGKKGKILDVGCNTGENLRALGSGWEMVGVELSPVLASIAAGINKCRVYDCPIEKLEEKNESFDVITAYAVIEHVFDPIEFIHELKNLLKQEGLLVLMTGDKDSSLAKKMGNEWPLYISKDHVSFFSEKSLEILLLNAGFKILEKNWRFVYFKNGPGSKFTRVIMRIKELLSKNDKNVYDHLYIYAKKL